MRIALVILALTLVQPAWATCTLSDIAIKSVKPKFVDKCRRSPCVTMTGVAVLTNRCSSPIGVQIKMTGFDKSGNPVSTNEGWPASIRNIPPGDYTFSLDQWLDYDPEIKSFELIPIQVKTW